MELGCPITNNIYIYIYIYLKVFKSMLYQRLRKLL